MEIIKELSLLSQETKSSRDFWIDTDIGGDIDDAFALITYLKYKKPTDKLHGVSTATIDPYQKAQIGKLILTELGQREISVYAGLGWHSSDPPEIFFKHHPMWPREAGCPDPKEGETPLYPYQGKAYSDLYPEMNKLEIFTDFDKLVSDFVAAAESAHNKLIVICIGPILNLAEVLRRKPEIASKLKFVIMGGWYEDKEGLKIKRPGYNIGINPIDSYVIFNCGAEITLVHSEWVRQKNFVVNDLEYDEIIKFAGKTTLGKALTQDWIYYNSIRVRSRHIADPFTVYVALFPDIITEYELVKLHFAIFVDQQKNVSLSSELNGVNFYQSADKIMRIERDVADGQKVIRKILSGSLEDNEDVRKRIILPIKEVLLKT
jgi:inosine-uridine nucleoside N-ribohydrolase